MRRLWCLPAVFFCLVPCTLAIAQSGPVLPGGSGGSRSYDPLGEHPADATTAGSLLAQPTMSPGALELMELDRSFSAAVARGGGKAFAEWMADDGVSLSNKQAAKLGKGAIAAGANWDPSVYQLTWTPSGAQMGPSNDMGFTWGHYEGHSRDAHGQSVVVSGRYITVWKRVATGRWKVALDASQEEPPAAGDCCALPKP